MKPLKIALDWTPNINHIGLLVAKELDFYRENGIDLVLIDPKTDNYQLTPGKKLELNLADFAIAPFETVISLNNKKNQVDALAIYAILQEDISSIVSLKSKKLTRPKSLDGKTYASYKARYEDKIVQEMVKNDGGLGEFAISYPNKLGIWNILLEGKADTTWIFDNWEGIEAATKKIELTHWSLKDYNIPYGYSPVIITKKSNLNLYQSEYRNFIKATQKGYLFAQEHSAATLAILKKYLKADEIQKIDLVKALEATKPYLGDSETAGFINPERVRLFLNWLVQKKLENKIILTQDLFTNALL